MSAVMVKRFIVMPNLLFLPYQWVRPLAVLLASTHKG